MHLTKKFALMLTLLLLCVGCGSSTSTPAGMTAASWVGTWSGQVDWTGAAPNAGDNVTITISAPVTSTPGSAGCPVAVGGNCYTSQFTGSDSGNQCAGNGVPVGLAGEVFTFANTSFNTATVTVGTEGQNGATCPNLILIQYNWTLTPNSLTIATSAGVTIGTLTK